MNIDLHNYEAFFLDHKEGNLSAELQKELFLFLEKHPHLYEELAAFENVTLDDIGTAEFFSGKESIKKAEFTTEDIIAYTEGIADAKTKIEIETLASQNRDLKKEIALYEAAVLQADLSIKFKNKETLKKRGVVIALQNNYNFLRIAAAVLLLIGLFFLISNLTSSELKNEKVVADGSQKSLVKSQESKAVGPEIQNENKRLSDNSQEPLVETQKSGVGGHKVFVSKVKEENSVKENIPQENKNVAINTPITNTVTVIKENKEEPVVSNNTSIKNESVESPTTIKSYYNYRPDT
ncbi:MAG: hypothetical protein ACXVC6_09335, partial [Bacteroidia bacterium]